jgi:hypothetical protein
MKIEVEWKIEKSNRIEIAPEEYNQIVRDSDGNKHLIVLALENFDKKNRNDLNWRQLWGRGKNRKWTRGGSRRMQLQGMKILEE